MSGGNGLNHEVPRTRGRRRERSAWRLRDECARERSTGNGNRENMTHDGSPFLTLNDATGVCATDDTPACVARRLR